MNKPNEITNKLFDLAHDLRGMATAACQKELIYTVVKYVALSQQLERMAQQIERQIEADRLNK